VTGGPTTPDGPLPPTPLLEVHMSAGYADSTVLDGLALTLYPGDCLGLVGSSGAGKSTLVMALLGLLPWRRGWARGQVLLNGVNILDLGEREARRIRGRHIALVPQSPASALNPSLSLRTHFQEAWRAHRPGLTGLEPRLAGLLDQVQLPSTADFLSRKPDQISVGQAQRAVLAMALLHRPALLVADEPTSALDPATQFEVLQLLRRIQHEQGTALLYISHDLLSVLQLCDRIAVLSGKTISTTLPVASLSEDNASPALRILLRALPIPVEILLRNLKTEGVDRLIPPKVTLLQP
jgi:ABC-type glutathione transport system ATPase component